MMTIAGPEVSLYEGFFSGGARILQSQIIGERQAAGTPQVVMSIADKVDRECTYQPMEDDPCYQNLVAAGVAVQSLGRHGKREPDHSPFTPAELADFARVAAGSRLLITLKEQPMRLANQADLDVPTVVCLHRSDPEHQGRALDELRQGVRAGRIAAITQVARSGVRAYVEAGIPEYLIHYIPTGVDLNRFKPDAAEGERLRAELGINATAPTVAIAVRHDDMKDVPLFLASGREYLQAEPDAQLIACGAGMRWDNPALQNEIGAAFADVPWLTGRLHLLGICRQVERVYNAADIVALTSRYGETRPLCLIEGLACEAVPVTTDVGDSADIVAEGRGIVTSHSPSDIADAWRRAYDKRADHQAAIRDTRHSFGQAAMIAAYGAVFDRYAT